jgi:hypothetical protein
MLLQANLASTMSCPPSLRSPLSGGGRVAAPARLTELACPGLACSRNYLVITAFCLGSRSFYAKPSTRLGRGYLLPL